MNCEDAKRNIRNGNPRRAAEHLEKCADCRAFAESFEGISEVLENIPAPPAPPEGLLEKTLASASREMTLAGQAEVARPPVPRARAAAAASFALIFAPLLVIANYAVAYSVQELLSGWLSPVIGIAFFVSYALGAVLVMGTAYGSLPLIYAAAAKTLKKRRVYSAA